MRRKRVDDPWFFYMFDGSAPWALILDFLEICGGVFCGFREAIVHKASIQGRANVETSGIGSYEAFLGH